MITQLVASQQPCPGADVQETTFSLDAVARFVCNTMDEVTAAQAQGAFAFDAIVIGSGMYGAYTAAKIFERARRADLPERPRVLVLEAGPFLISEHFQNLTRMGPFFELVNKPIVDENQAFLTQIDRIDGPLQGMERHHRVVGGKSLFWGGWAPPLSNEDREDDLAQWPAEIRDFLLSSEGYEHIGRQIGTDVTTDYIKGELHDQLLLKAKQIVAAGMASGLTGVCDAPIAVQAEGPVSGLFSMDKFSSLPLLLDSIREDAEQSGGVNGNRHLFLVPNAQVLRMETREGRVHELVVLVHEPSHDVNHPGAQQHIKRLALKGGAIVIIAGNAINSTRLALNSLPRPRPLGPELIGKNLMAHVRGNFFWRIRKDALNLPPLQDLSTTALHIEGRVPIGPPVNRLGRFHFQFCALGSGEHADGENPEEFLYRLIPNTEDLGDAQRAVRTTDLEDWIVVGIRTCGEMFGDPDADPSRRDASTISVNPFGGAGDDVYIDDHGQEIRVPKVFVALVQRPADKAIRDAQTGAAFALIEALAGAPAGAARSTTGSDIRFIRGHEDGMGTTYHESGTLWMGVDPATSVTDVHGHLHHITNAFCVDQSLFPTVGSANPVPTGLALSSMIASHIVSRFVSAPLEPIETGFTSLFDGTLNGWEQFGAGTIQALPEWDIIECGTSGTESVLGFVRTRKKYRNFVLKLDWKAFDIAANSGVFLRMPDVIDDDLQRVYRESIEIQIDETGKNFQADRDPQWLYGSSLHKTGAVYGVAPATRWASKAVSRYGSDGYWNAYEIMVQDDSISVQLNGELVVDNAQLPAHLTRDGYIGLQCHTDVVQFRNIRLMEL
ncbi:MAG: family 16 glycoside hydrolase [Dehalococcoidia bacterium]